MWQTRSMARSYSGIGFLLTASILAAGGIVLLASAAKAEPRLERERCLFKPPRGDHLECFVLDVPEDRSRPEGREVRLRGVILKARRGKLAEPVVYLSGGPGDTPLVASEPGIDPLIEGDWWKDTAVLRRRRDVIIISQRGAGGATPDLDCFLPRIGEPAKARRRAVTEQQEHSILLGCREALERRKIDLAMYATPVLADDVADLARALSLPKINLYGASYGTRWGLEILRRHPDLVRAAVLDGVYPPQVNGEQNEPGIVRAVFEQLYAECDADAFCREHHPALRQTVETLVEGADRSPLDITLQLEDGPQPARLDSAKLMLVLLQMMREGEAALIPEAVAAAGRGNFNLLTLFGEDLEDDEGGLLEQNAQQFDGLFNSVECRETWAAVDLAARQGAIDQAGIYGLSTRFSKSAIYCPAWRVPAAPAAERQPVKSAVPVLLLSGGYDWLTPPSWAADAARTLSASRQVVFRALGHGVTSQDSCAARLRDAFIENPEAKRPPTCTADAPPNFATAAERARALP
jgi:pimeloyl-ACP methyl ester carboxylesterase